MSSYEVWQGRSRISGKSIVALATVGSQNEKTGNCISVQFTCSNVDPMSAIRLGMDSDVCGACVFRGAKGDGTDRGCYVNINWSVRAVWEAWKAGNCPPQDGAFFRSQNRFLPIRFGSYGDPTSVDLSILLSMLNTTKSAGHFGYTQFWQKPENQEYKRILMASCTTMAQVRECESMGWRAYYVPIDGKRPVGLTECPASIYLTDDTGNVVRDAEGKKVKKHDVQCRDCKLCVGSNPDAYHPTRSIFAFGHGSALKLRAITKLNSRGLDILG